MQRHKPSQPTAAVVFGGASASDEAQPLNAASALDALSEPKGGAPKSRCSRLYFVPLFLVLLFVAAKVVVSGSAIKDERNKLQDALADAQAEIERLRADSKQVAEQSKAQADLLTKQVEEERKRAGTEAAKVKEGVDQATNLQSQVAQLEERASKAEVEKEACLKINRNIRKELASYESASDGKSEEQPAAQTEAESDEAKAEGTDGDAAEEKGAGDAQSGEPKAEETKEEPAETANAPAGEPAAKAE